MIRRMAIILLSLAAAFVAAAEEYTDAAAHFRLTIPEGWEKSINPEQEIALLVISPRAEETLGFCMIQSSPLPGTDTLTQEEIDESLAGHFDKPFWEGALKEAGMKDAAIETTGEEKQNRRNTYFAVASYADGDRRIKLKVVSHFVPGRAQSLYCVAYAEGYAREDADFETVFDSFTPLDGGLVAGRNPRSPSATLGTMKGAFDPRVMRNTTAEGSRAVRTFVRARRSLTRRR